MSLLLLHTEVSLLVSRDNVQQHFVSGHRVRGPHPENVSRDGSVDGEADVVERDSQRKRITRRRILSELASYALATAEKEKTKYSQEEEEHVEMAAKRWRSKRIEAGTREWISQTTHKNPQHRKT